MKLVKNRFLGNRRVNFLKKLNKIKRLADNTVLKKKETILK